VTEVSVDEPSAEENASEDIVWVMTGELGYPEAIQTAGTVAAPLLAGFSLTMVALLLPTISNADRTFARWGDLALGFLMAAAILLIMAVQCAMHARSYQVTPDELMSWWGRPGGRPTPAILHNQKVHANKNRYWAAWTRWTYDLGIVLLMAALPLMVLPPGKIPMGRWFIEIITIIGFVVEASWVMWVNRPRRKQSATA
jgi:hypothetical protein